MQKEAALLTWIAFRRLTALHTFVVIGNNANKADPKIVGGRARQTRIEADQ